VGFRVPKRRADWLLGRLTAKSVVAEALREVLPGDWRPATIELANEPSGMPYARLARDAYPIAGFTPGERLPVSVSISHAEGHALCAATWATPLEGGSRRALGIDLGRVEPRSRELVATFFTDDEQRFVRDATGLRRDLRANLIWCAKEAVLKALGLGLTVDTLDVTCLPGRGPVDPAAWSLAPAGAAWRPFVARCGPALAPEASTIRGVWRVFPGFVGALASNVRSRTAERVRETST
jgi:4'-phosphopantetheinyl transferase